MEKYRKPTPIGTFEKEADPKWEIGEVVKDPNGNDKIVTHREATLGNLRVTYFGVPPVEPVDPLKQHHDNPNHRRSFDAGADDGRTRPR